MVKLLLRSLFLFGSAIHLPVSASGRTENQGAYELRTHDDIMKMKVGGALYITVFTELQGNPGLHSARRGVDPIPCTGQGKIGQPCGTSTTL